MSPFTNGLITISEGDRKGTVQWKVTLNYQAWQLVQTAGIPSRRRLRSGRFGKGAWTEYHVDGEEAIGKNAEIFKQSDAIKTKK